MATFRVTFFTAFFILFTSPATASHTVSIFDSFKNPQAIFKYGFEALQANRQADAFAAFRYGASHEHLASEWKLARMLQSRNDGAKDHITAYRLFQRIALRFQTKRTGFHDRPYVSNAVISLGDYSLMGIDGSDIGVDPHLAEYYYFRAAALYGDREAEFKLGMLYASDLLGQKRLRSAMRWYSLASYKGHALAQTELGDMFFRGQAGQKNRIRGLAYLAYAAMHSDFEECEKRYKKAFLKADKTQRAAALRISKALRFPNTPRKN